MQTIVLGKLRAPSDNRCLLPGIALEDHEFKYLRERSVTTQRSRVSLSLHVEKHASTS